MAGAAAALFLASACEDVFTPEEEYTGPVVPDIGGEWKGYFYFDESHGGNRWMTPITATVVLNSSNHTYVTVTTSKQGLAHYLAGRIDSTGYMRMIDPYDGETWTTYRRRATSNLVEINDMAFEGELGRGMGFGLFTVLLDRHLPPEEPDSGFSLF
jgi:hypothetical protein